jgi:DNA-binding GntR family transcriptional regulator
VGHNGPVPIPAHAPAVGRSLLRDDVYGRLRDAIVDGTFEPGEQLRDGELAAWLGVSRTPVREALLRLARGGLVVARPGRSTVVSPLDVRAVREARDVVAAMHRLAVHDAVPHLSDEDVDAMRAAAARFAAAIEAGDVDAAIAADDELHGIPVAVADNRAAAAVLEQFTPVLRRAERRRFAAPDAQESLERHEELIGLCAVRDADGAAAVAARLWEGLPPDPADDRPTAS